MSNFFCTVSDDSVHNFRDRGKADILVPPHHRSQTAGHSARPRSGRGARSGRAMATVVAHHVHHHHDHHHGRGKHSKESDRSAVAAIHDLSAAPLSGKPLQTAIQKAFERFDEDGNGAIDREEFRIAMFGLGLRRSSAEYDELYREYDRNGDGEIDVDEFGEMVRMLMEKNKVVEHTLVDNHVNGKGKGAGAKTTKSAAQEGVHAQACAGKCAVRRVPPLRVASHSVR